ncbi:MAG: DUF3617 family protein [Hyphomonadaceae bacterium]
MKPQSLKALLGAVAAIGLMTSAAHAQELAAKPGKWESTTNMSMTLNVQGRTINVPGTGFTNSHCLKPDDAKFKASDLAREGCEVSNVTSTATSMKFDLKCDQGGAAMVGAMTFNMNSSRDSGEGTIAMSGSMPGQGAMAASGTIKSKRIGDC